MNPNNSKLLGSGITRPLPRLVGRERELQQAQDYIHRLASDHTGGFLFIVGEAGVGKSSLVSEVLSLTRAEDRVLPLFGECHSLEHSPYLPIVKSLASFLASNNSDSANSRLRSLVSQSFGEVVSMIPHLANLVGVTDRIQELRRTGYIPSFAPYQGKTLISFATFLTKLAERRPILLILDDVQWADDDTLGLLSYLAESIDSRSLFVMGTVRSEALTEGSSGGAARSLVEDLLRNGRASRLNLVRLPPQEISSLVERFQGKHSLTQDELDTLFHETEGNPYFLRESLCLLIEQQVLTRDHEVLHAVRPIRTALVPQTVREAIRSRIQRLPPVFRRPLDAASVVGSVFDSEAVSQMIDENRFHLLEQLRDLETVYSLVERINGHHKFYHIKIQETIYQDLPFDLRSRYHVAVGEYLAGRGSSENQEMAADHFLDGGDSLRASQILLTAGRSAFSDQNYRAAERILTKWLNLAHERLEKGAPPELLELTHLRALTRYRLGRYLDVLGDSRTVSLSPDCPSSLRVQSTHLEGRACYFLNLQEDCIRAYAQSLSLAEGSSDWKMAFLNHLSLAAIYDLNGAYSDMESHFFSAERLALSHQDKEALADVQMKYGMIIMDEPPRVIPRIQEAIRLYTEVGNSRGAAAAHLNLGNEYFFQKDIERAHEHYSRSLSILEESDGVEQCYPLNNLSLAFQCRGDHPSALKMLSAALSRYLTPYHKVFILNNTANSLRALGKSEEAVRTLQSILPEAAAECDPFVRELTYYNLGMAQLDAGQVQEAITWLQKSFSDRTKSNAALNRGKRCKALGIAYSRIGNAEQQAFWENKSQELLASDVPDRWYYAEIDYEAADLSFYE